MAENNIEEPLQNNTQESNENNIPETYQNNFAEETNIPVAYQNNIPKPYQNNFPQPDQNNPQLSQNQIPGPYQNNNLGPFQNNFVPNNLTQGIVEEELNKKMKDLKAIYCSILVVIFLLEIVLEFVCVSLFGESKEHDDMHSYFGEGLIGVIYVIMIYPFLIILSSYILCLFFYDYCPNTKIVLSVIICIGRGFIMLIFFNEGKGRLRNIGIILEILNLSFMITSISYQIQIKRYKSD